MAEALLAHDADRNGYLDDRSSTPSSPRNAIPPTSRSSERSSVSNVDGDGRVSEQEMVDALLADIRRRQP